MSLTAHLKEIGRGAEGSRALSIEAAEDALGQVLDGACSEAEAGAFLIAMRMKGESIDELRGFLRAVEARCLRIESDRPVVVLPSYNGSRRLPNLTPLLAAWLAREGHRVLVHGPLDDPTRVTSAEVFADLGMPPARRVFAATDVHDAWARREPAFLPTRVLSPALRTLLDRRWVLGVRGPGHTVAKMLAPIVGARALRVVNHTHPEFGRLMAEWAEADGVDALLLRGTEGEPVADPRRLPRLDVVLGGRLQPDLCLAGQDGVLAELPLLPRAVDAASTARHVQEVLSGERPAPVPIVRQAALIGDVLAAMARTGAAPVQQALA